MNTEIKAAWLQALRSGEYEQGKGQLHADNTFCCLGVLCDLHAKAGFGKWEEDEFGVYPYLSEMQLPPDTVIKWAGLDNRNPSVGGNVLTTLNDGVEGYDEDEDCEVILEPSYSFAEIADLIEQYL